MIRSLITLLIIVLIGGMLFARPTCEIALPELKLCAYLNSVECMECLGLHYENASPPDYTQSANYFLEAADKGSIGSMIQIGNFYRRGNGVSVDPEKGLEWYLRAVKQNPDYNPETLLAVGLMYKNGEGNPVNPIEGLKYVKQAAEKGHLRAIALYGLYVTRGEGTDANPVEGYAWLKLAMLGLRDPALLKEIDTEMDRLKYALTEAELAEAEKRFESLGKSQIRSSVMQF